MLDFIDSNAFANFAQYSLNPQFTGDVVSWNTDITKQNSIIFVKRGLLDMFFNNIQHSSYKHILITHLGDEPIDEAEFIKKPKCVVKWFAQNASYDHPDLVPIPIGIENHTGICSEAIPGRFDFFSKNIEKLRENPKNIDTLYCNWSICNNVKERGSVLEKLKVKYIWDNTYAPGQNNMITHRTFSDYFERSTHYKFLVSPPGNGIDCLRTWEALYLNSFPIVLKHNMYKNFNDLPIIQVNDWSEITYDLLHSYLDKEYNYEKIYMPYWRNLILNEYNKL